MPDTAAIEKAIQGMDKYSQWLSKREIKELPNILTEGELPQKIVQGFYVDGNGVLVATDRRLIFVNKGIFSLKVEDFPYEKISSIQYKTSLLMGEIEIFASGNKAQITNITKDQARPFAEWVRAQLSSPRVPSQGTSDDTISKLERLAQLKKDGILNEDEFQQQKQQLLKQA